MVNQNLKLKILSIILFIISGVFLSTENSLAADHYIRAGATGANNGSSWADAWNSFSSVTWTRGDTYYLAGGTYNGDVTISAPESGTNWITIKKANATNNGSNSGWNASYAETQAVINGSFIVNYGYFEIDGVIGSGTFGHGIKIHLDSSRNGLNSVFAFPNSTPSPRHLFHLDIQGPGFDADALTGGVYWNSSNAGSKGFHIDSCWIHETAANALTFGTVSGTSYPDYGLLIENSVIERSGTERYPTNHAQQIQFYYYPLSYAIIRNNIFRNATGQSHISILGGVSTNYLRVYNNIFYNDSGNCAVAGIADSGTSTSITQLNRQFDNYENIVGATLTNSTRNATGTITGVSGTLITVADGMSGGATNVTGDQFSINPIPCRSAYFMATSIYSSEGNTITNAEIYNNTFYNIGKAAINFVTPSDSTGTLAKNNLWVNSYFTDTRSLWPPMTNTGYYNNIYGAYDPINTETADPFVNSATYDFHLKSTANAKDSGADLSSVFATDIEGTTRPPGSWDIGAYEFDEGYDPGSIAPGVPTGLMVQ